MFACTGSPVDCVRVGLLSGLVAPVDLVVSGINHGLNVGDDVTYSGTVGAALEAAILDVPAIAVSQQADDRSFRFNDSGLRISFRLAAEAAHCWCRTVVTQPPPARTVLNVNLPSTDGSPRVVLTRPGRRYFAPDVVKAVGGVADGQAFYPYGLPSDPAPRYDDGEDTDFAALRAGCISVSLLAGGAADEASAPRRSWFGETFDLHERSAMTPALPGTRVPSLSAAASPGRRPPITWPARGGRTSSCSSRTRSAPAPRGTRPAPSDACG